MRGVFGEVSKLFPREDIVLGTVGVSLWVIFLSVGLFRCRIEFCSRISFGIVKYFDNTGILLRMYIIMVLFSFIIAGGRSTITKATCKVDLSIIPSSFHNCHSVYSFSCIRALSCPTRMSR